MLAILGLPNLVVVTLAVAILALVFRRRLVGAVDRTATTWSTAWLKAVVLVVAVTFLAVYVPSWLLQTRTVSAWSRTAQELVGAGVWLVVLIAFLAVLRIAYRREVL